MATKKEQEARAKLNQQWPDFVTQKQGILQRRSHGRTLSEDDVEQMLSSSFRVRLATIFGRSAPSSAAYRYVGRQQDYADRTLEGQGIKPAVVEINRHRI